MAKYLVDEAGDLYGYNPEMAKLPGMRVVDIDPENPVIPPPDDDTEIPVDPNAGTGGGAVAGDDPDDVVAQAIAKAAARGQAELSDPVEPVVEDELSDPVADEVVETDEERAAREELEEAERAAEAAKHRRRR